MNSKKIRLRRVQRSKERNSAFISSIKSTLFPKLNHNSIFNLEGVPFEEKKIPRILHQTFYTKDLPAELHESVEIIKGKNVGWEYRFYSDSDISEFIYENYDSDVYRIFRKLDPSYGAAKADLFRYLVLYKCGGVYLDIKASASKPFDAMITSDDRYLICQWPHAGQFTGWGAHGDLADIHGGEFQQWNIAASPGHPFLKAVIENVLSNIEKYNPSLHGTGKTGVLRVTGPVAYTLAIAPLLNKYPHRLEKNHMDVGFSYSIYSKEANGPVNEIHKEKFRSHYSKLRKPLVKPGLTGNTWAGITRFANCIHNLSQQKIIKTPSKSP